jgi:hypothetical protein
LKLFHRHGTQASVLALLLGLSARFSEASAEWDMAGYGGISTGGALRNVTMNTFNVIVRYPDQIVQPYLGVGAGAFYFFSSSSGPIQGRQWVPGLNVLAGFKLFLTDERGVFAEGKYNYAAVSTFDPTFGVSGAYSIFHAVGGVAFRF